MVRSVKKTVWGTVFSDARVGAVGRQGQEPGPDFAQDSCRFGAFVTGQVIQNDHVARLQSLGKPGLDIEVEEVPVDRAINDPRRSWRRAAIKVWVFPLSRFASKPLPGNEWPKGA